MGDECPPTGMFFSPTLNLGQNSTRVQEVEVDRWKGREYVCSINAGKREGGSGGKVRRGTGGRGQGEHVERCQNQRHICCSPRMFPVSFNCFLQPCESAQNCQGGGGGEVIGGLPTFISIAIFL